MVRGIMMEQIRMLRFRSLLERFVNHGDAGCYVQIGHTRQDILRMTGRQDGEGQLDGNCLSPEEVERAAAVPTAITRLSPDTFELLFRHGFEVADYTMHACQPDAFSYIGYTQPARRQPVLRSAPKGEPRIVETGWPAPVPAGMTLSEPVTR
jgi:hypothetical protein